MASSILQQIAKDDEMRIRVFSREKAEMDRVSEINYAVRKGIEQNRMNILRKMRGKYDAQSISEIIGMSLAEVESALNNLDDVTAD